MKNVLEYLEQTEARDGSRCQFFDSDISLTASGFLHRARSIGTTLLKLKSKNRAIAVYFDKSVECLAAMMGVLYSGNFYVVMDTGMPEQRVADIFKTLEPVAILASKEYAERVSRFGVPVITDTVTAIDEAGLTAVRRQMIDTDPAYALFTSGSTGVPKGAVVSHRSIIAYIEWVTNQFGFDKTTVFGSQTPFYFSMSVTDFYSSLKTGAEFHIIPKMCFSFPIKLVEFLNEKKVNTIYWVPSALSIVANFKTFDYAKPQYLEKILFAGEVMPIKQLNYWRNAFSEALFANLYGPTETTDICTYYVVDREFDNAATLPIGKACDNCDVFVVADGKEVTEAGVEGELYARGSFLADGYYNNPEKTEAAFVQNPLNTHYPERVYRTGDLVKYNELGELLYITRRDFQIKHMGYRIELGEIEAAVGAIDGIKSCAALYDENTDKIAVVYESVKLDESVILDNASKRLPPYMMPQILMRVKQMPYNENGKIHRKKLLEMVKAK